MNAESFRWIWVVAATLAVALLWSPEVLAQVGPADRLNGVADTTNARSFGFLEIALLIGIPGALVVFFMWSDD